MNSKESKIALGLASVVVLGLAAYSLSARQTQPKEIVEVQEVKTKAEFDQLVKGDKLVVVDFTATWCPPCMSIAPKFAQLAQKIGDAAIFVKVDVDENEETAQECEINCMPSFQFYKKGVKLHEIEGADIAAVEAKTYELK